MAVIELFNEQLAQISKIDNVFDSLEDTAAAGRRKVTSELIASVSDRVEPVAQDMITKIESLDEDTRYSVYLGFVRALNKKFEKEASKFVDSKIPPPDPNAEANKPSISDEQRKTLLENRAKLLGQAKVLGAMAVDMGEMSEQEFEDRLPKRRNIAGPRGKRAISNYTLTVGETTYETMAEVAKANGYDKASELTKAIRETQGPEGKGINLTKPPKEFEFTLKNGQTLKAVDRRSDAERNEAEADTSSDDNSNDDDDDNENED